MKGLADARIEDAILRRLEEGPADLLDLVAAARVAAAGPLARHEGAFHALLHRLVREGKVVPSGVGPSHGTRYALRGAAVAAVDSVPEAPPPTARSDQRAALLVAGLLKDPGDRGRVVADVLAHRRALAAEGRAKSFGAAKPLRMLIRRADRGQALIAVPETTWELGVRWVVHEGPSVLGTAIGIGLLWLFVAEFRRVPSNSMQPTLKPGDYLLVRKAFAKHAPERWTNLVFRKSNSETVLVKRVAGLPGESIAIREGDFLVDGRIAVKPEALRESLREPLFRQRLDGIVPADGWSVSRDGPLRRYAKPLFGDEPSHGDQGPTGLRPLVHDVYFGAEVSGPASLRIEFADEVGEPANAVLGVAWSRDAAGREVVGVLDAAGVLRPLAEGRAPAGSGTSRVTLAVVDGRLRLWAATWEHAADVEVPEGRARLGIEGAVRSVAVDRDVHYTSDGVYAVDPATPYRVPEGHVFCLGDNSAHSGDSRIREVGPIPFDSFIGPVIFRVFPPWRIGIPK